MSEDYPESGPPRYELSAPFLRGAQKQHLDRMLNDIYADNIGQCMIHLWVEALQDFWTEHEASVSTACDLQAEDQLSEASTVEHSSAKCPDINTGDCIEDRKSVFQGHFAKVKSEYEVRQVVNKLKENKKIANATHNILAYRIRTEAGSMLCDCDDDGETKAGARLLELLTILDVCDIVVVVTRWYGGSKLGADRFKHINNAARNVLDQHGVLKSPKGKS